MIVTSVQIKTAKTQKHLYCPVFTLYKVLQTLSLQGFSFICNGSPAFYCTILGNNIHKYGAPFFTFGNTKCLCYRHGLPCLRLWYPEFDVPAYRCELILSQGNQEVCHEREISHAGISENLKEKRCLSLQAALFSSVAKKMKKTVEFPGILWYNQERI